MAQPRTLRGFLLARIAEEESAARNSLTWYAGNGSAPLPSATAAIPEAFAAFVLAHSPDRVLAECAGKRRIINRVTGARWSGSDEDQQAILRMLAAPYADHPGFREEWGTAGA